MREHWENVPLKEKKNRKHTKRGPRKREKMERRTHRLFKADLNRVVEITDLIVVVCMIS